MAAATKTYQLLVIGGGSGGLATARRAAEFGIKAAVIENSRYGGTCVVRGCVPKKVMWYTANMADALHHKMHNDYGFDVEYKGFSWPTIKAKRDAYVDRLVGIYENNLAKANIDAIRGKAVFTGPKEVSVDGTKYTADHIVIASGGHAVVPNIPGKELGITSDGFFHLEDLPKKAAVVGAGYIAIELAGILRSLGSEVSLLIRHDRFLRTFDEPVVDRLMKHMETTGVNIIRQSNISALSKDGDNITMAYKQNGEDKSMAGLDTVLFAIGRKPNVDIGLDVAGIELTDKGYIKVDAEQNTTTAGVYALGDVCGRAELTPVAISTGRKLAHRLFEPRPQSKQDWDYIPSVVFSHPPLASVGYTEAEARKKFGDDQIKVYSTSFNAMAYAMSSSDKPPTMMRLICQLPNERVVGLHMLGDSVDEMLQGFSVAIKMGATKAQFDACVAIHPTSSEEVVTMR